MDLPGYRLIEHLSRTRRFDTYEVWSEDRACSCVAKVVREDRQEETRVREDLLAAIAIISPKPRGSTETYGGICLDPPGDQ